MFNNTNHCWYLRLVLGPVLNEIVDCKQIESRHDSTEDFGKLTQSQRYAVICLNKERRKLALDNQDNRQPINDTQNRNNISAFNSLPNKTICNIAAVDSIRNEPPDKNTVSNSIISSVSFNERNINPPSVTSGQIGEYLANSRKKASTIKAFTL